MNVALVCGGVLAAISAGFAWLLCRAAEEGDRREVAVCADCQQTAVTVPGASCAACQYAGGRPSHACLACPTPVPCEVPTRVPCPARRVPGCAMNRRCPCCGVPSRDVYGYGRGTNRWAADPCGCDLTREQAAALQAAIEQEGKS